MSQCTSKKSGALHVFALFKSFLRITAEGVPSTLIIMRIFGGPKHTLQAGHGRFGTSTVTQQMITCGPR